MFNPYTCTQKVLGGFWNSKIVEDPTDTHQIEFRHSSEMWLYGCSIMNWNGDEQTDQEMQMELATNMHES